MHTGTRFVILTFLYVPVVSGSRHIALTLNLRDFRPESDIAGTWGGGGGGGGGGGFISLNLRTLAVFFFYGRINRPRGTRVKGKREGCTGSRGSEIPWAIDVS